MALVRNGNKDKILSAKVDNNPIFDKQHKPGEECKHEGIYKCAGCEKEVTVAKEKKLPPQNHHQHTPQQGSILWQLFVYAQ